ncbi:type IV pilin protein [Acidovorax sp. D4N7]|nr:type IV pilin protein [Acidovorax sp. D4N7]
MDLASRQQKYYSINNRYTASAADLGYAALPASTASGLYSLSLTADSSSYTAKATPQGSQAKDVQCYGFAINDVGRKSNFSRTNAALTADCW